MGALVLNDEQSRHLPLDGRSDHHCSRLCRGLNSCRNVGCFPEHLAGLVDDDGTALEADTNRKLRSAGWCVSGVKFTQRLQDAEGGPDGSFSVILLRLRIA